MTAKDQSYWYPTCLDLIDLVGYRQTGKPVTRAYRKGWNNSDTSDFYFPLT